MQEPESGHPEEFLLVFEFNPVVTAGPSVPESRASSVTGPSARPVHSALSRRLHIHSHKAPGADAQTWTRSAATTTVGKDPEPLASAAQASAPASPAPMNVSRTCLLS